MFQSLFKRSSSHFAALLIGKALSTLVFIFLARVLHPGDFGEISLYITLLSLGTLLADFGLNQWYQKNASLLAKKDSLHDMLSGRLISLGVSMALMAALLVWGRSFGWLANALFILSLIPGALLSVFDGYYFSQKLPLRVSGKQIIRIGIFGIGLVWARTSTELEVLAMILLLADLITLVWYFPWKPMKGWRFSYREGVRTLKKSSRYAVLIFTSFAYARGDSLIIEYSLGSVFLGWYSAGYRYLESLSLFPAAIAQNLFHITSQKGGLNKKQLGRMTWFMLLAGLLFGALLFVSAELLTTILLGEAYAFTAPLVRIFSLVLVMFFVNSPLSTVVQSSEEFTRFLPWGIANTLLNIGLNLVFIPIYGVNSAAWIMLATEFSGFLINVWWVRKIYSS